MDFIMKKYKIIYQNNIELYNDEYFDRGYRDDVIVVINNKKYKLYIIEPIRLSQDFESEIIDYGYYQMEPNIIIVKKITRDEIEKVIDSLVKENFFEKLGAMS